MIGLHPGTGEPQVRQVDRESWPGIRVRLGPGTFRNGHQVRDQGGGNRIRIGCINSVAQDERQVGRSGTPTHMLRVDYNLGGGHWPGARRYAQPGRGEHHNEKPGMLSAHNSSEGVTWYLVFVERQ